MYNNHQNPVGASVNMHSAYVSNNLGWAALGRISSHASGVLQEELALTGATQPYSTFLSSSISKPRHVFMAVAEGNSSWVQSHKPLFRFTCICPPAFPRSKPRGKALVTRGVKNWGSKCNQSTMPKLCVDSWVCSPVKRKCAEAKDPRLGSIWFKYF